MQSQTSIQKMQALGISSLELSEVLPSTNTCVHKSEPTQYTYCGVTHPQSDCPPSLKVSVSLAKSMIAQIGHLIS